MQRNFHIYLDIINILFYDYIKEFKDYVVVREENIKNSLRQDGENFVENPKPRVIQKENVSDKKEANNY